jgi:type II secretory pathway predicted ATPase ExeA/pSer/pThr/pTyr-binding forkhead associated (FHA) protein
MPFNDVRLCRQAFGADADELTPLKLQSQQNADNYLQSILAGGRNAGLLYGPRLSGKSTIVRRFAAALPDDIAVAVVDGSGLAPNTFLSLILARFGYEVELQSGDDLLRLLTVFAVQQTRAVQSPVIIVENIDMMQPGALRALSMLSTLKFQGRFAVRIVLTGGSDAPTLLKSQGMLPIFQRISSVFEIEPLCRMESMLYLHGRLRATGIQHADDVLRVNVCDLLHELSGGLPGALNQVTKAVLGGAGSLPLSEADVQRYQEMEMKKKLPVPRLIVTNHGEVVEEFNVTDEKVTIGRSSLADIVVHNEYTSNFHALLLFHADALVLVDLNSANGTFVNSVAVKNALLSSDDIISIANHRIKVVDAPSADLDHYSAESTGDTMKMKTLTEMREQKKMRITRFAFGGKKIEKLK